MPNYMQLFGKLLLLPTIKSHLGITTLELLIVVIIITILTIIAVPSFNTFLQNHRLMMTADNLFASMQYARSEAIKQNTTVFVSFQTGDSWCYGLNTSSSCNCTVPSACNLGTTQAAQAQQISFSTTGLTGNGFQIEGSRGAANVSGAKVTMTLYGQSTSISLLINQLGNYQLCSSMSGYQACP
ncbi:MAG: GspH/FimT family protein [Gammaproteobacteria bacterium]|nr:GspH/FimT family protein [Gammaproteobacteria bacterium]